MKKETGIELKQIPMEEIGKWTITGFAADDNGRVRGLAIHNKKLPHLPALLSKCQRLEELVLYNNQISDISSLKELKNLKRLYLMNNKITHMPAEFLDLGLEIKWKWDNKECIYLEGNPLESPPAKIILKGMDAIRHYFQSLSVGQQALKQGRFDKIDKELFFISYSRRDEEFVLKNRGRCLKVIKSGSKLLIIFRHRPLSSVGCFSESKKSACWD